jgi:hypothetical protein
LASPQALQGLPGVGRLGLGGGTGDNVSAWKPEDFRKARADRDPRLIAAIAALGPGRASSDKAAKLLIDLLPAPVGGAPAVAAAPPMPPTDPAQPAAAATVAAPTEDIVIAAIITALGANYTATSRAALKQLLLGELKTSLPDGTATGMAAQAILKKPTPDEQAMLLAAVGNPALLRPGAAADPSLSAQLLAAIDTRASSEVRVALAELAGRKNTSGEQRKAIVAMLSKPVPVNLAAQARLFRSSKTDAATKLEFEKRFATYSAAAVDHLLGLGSGGLPMGESAGDASGTAGEAAMLQAVVDNVWGEEVVAGIESKASDVEKIAEFADPLAFATSVPMKDMRTVLGQLQHEHWSDGTKDIHLGQRFGDGIHDPGMLLVVKRTPRKDAPPKKKLKDGETPPPPRPTRQRRGRGNQQGPTRTQKEETARHEWMRATEDFVQSLNDRFLTAARAGAGQRHLITHTKAVAGKSPAANPVSSTAGRTTTAAAKGADMPSAAERAAQFPLELHEGARVVAEYHVCWPEDLPKRLQNSQLTPLAVHYVRMEDTSSLTKLNTHYLTQLKGVTPRQRPYGRWLDWMGQGVERGQARTVDVIFTRAKPSDEEEEDEASTTRRGVDEPEPLVTEILVIEIPEYKVAPSEDDDSSPPKPKSAKLNTLK